ncbi:MAG: RnfABCDGE type electron transport complex subunit D [Candidatus Aureabacteria bacterium]|nr:RnfABCDGE type electron transport complex subunit D [Candidatus Auribacterota bacterium]
MPKKNHDNKIIQSAPFISASDSVTRIMWDVVISLIPAIALSIYFFGIASAFIIMVSVASCVAFDSFCISFRTNKNISFGSPFDGSAVITGILLAFNLPATVPWWLVVISSAVAIIVTKHFFGGIGKNIFNPALAGRIFAMHAWPDYMSASWIPPRSQWEDLQASFFSLDNSPVREAFQSYATPLAHLKDGALAKMPALSDMFLGNIGGCLGETSVLALLLGALFLLFKKRITLTIPLTYIGTVGLLTWIFGGQKLFTGPFLFHILGGGLVLGAFYMATDMVTSPYTAKGQFIFAALAGVLTTLIRLKGGFPEGVSYSIFFMNALVPIIDRYTRIRIYGTRKEKEKNG